MKLRRNALLVLASLSWISATAFAQSTFFWTGANSTASGGGYVYSDGGDASNWQGNTLPPFESLTGNTLTFGSTRDGTNTIAFVSLPSTDVLGLIFTTPRPNYMLYVASGSLGLGAAGIVAPGISDIKLMAPIILTANQTWSVQSDLVVEGNIGESTAGLQLTKTGDGNLTLQGDASNFSALNILGGSLTLGANSTKSGEFISGPAGAGVLTLGDNTRLQTTVQGNVDLHNPLSLGNAVTFGNYFNDASFMVYGTVTPQQTNTRINLGVDGAVFFQGNLVDSAAGATTFTFAKAPGETTVVSAGTAEDSFPVAVLGGLNTYTGGTTVDGAGVIFFSPTALPATGNIAAVNDGYVGAAFNGGLAAVISRIASPGTFSGSLGLDTNPDVAGAPNEFDDAINLATFTPDSGPTGGIFWGLGTLTFAQLSSASSITPPTGGNYLFGGGEGTLFVGTNLGVPSNSPNAGVRVRSLFGDSPLTVYLQGNNTFTGNLLVDHSIVVLDSSNALPAGASISLDSQAYVGVTENSLLPAQLIARVANYNHDSIIGFDHSSSSPDGVTITEAVNLSNLGDIYLGTTTHAHLAGVIRAPSGGGTLSLTGLKGGRLTIDTALAPTYTNGPSTVTGVSSVRVGMANGSDDFKRSYVELANPGSTYAGGTTLQSGYLLVGGSSTVVGSTLTAGPLGIGSLTFNGYDYGNPATLVVTNSDGIILLNPIHFESGATGRFGVRSSDSGDDDDSARPVSEFSNNSLTLAGNITGLAGYVQFTGQTTYTLTGDNAGLHAGQIVIGDQGRLGETRVIATTASALGDSNTPILLNPGTDLVFSSPEPLGGGEIAGIPATSPSPAPINFSIGSISGGTPAGADTSNLSHLTLEDGDSLTINQFHDGVLYANIGGPRSSWDGDPTEATTASVTKNGSGILTLAGDNAFSGGLTINSGGIIAATNTALGTGTVTINGGTLGVKNNATIANALAFGPAGATLGGNAIFTTPITVGANVTLAPGNSPGILSFTNGLTLAAGGTLSLDIVDLSRAAGVGYDTVNVTGGTLDLTATTANPFTIQINSLSALSNTLGALTTDSSTAVSLTILQAPGAITGLIGDGTSGVSNLVLDTTNFSAYQGGTFSLSLGGASNSALLLNFTPVPEPSTYALIGLGLAFVGWQLHRRCRVR